MSPDGQVGGERSSQRVGRQRKAAGAQLTKTPRKTAFSLISSGGAKRGGNPQEQSGRLKMNSNRREITAGKKEESGEREGHESNLAQHTNHRSVHQQSYREGPRRHLRPTTNSLDKSKLVPDYHREENRCEHRKLWGGAGQRETSDLCLKKKKRNPLVGTCRAGNPYAQKGGWIRVGREERSCWGDEG